MSLHYTAESRLGSSFESPLTDVYSGTSRQLPNNVLIHINSIDSLVAIRHASMFLTEAQNQLECSPDYLKWLALPEGIRHPLRSNIAKVLSAALDSGANLSPRMAVAAGNLLSENDYTRHAEDIRATLQKGDDEIMLQAFNVLLNANEAQEYREARLDGPLEEVEWTYRQDSASIKKMDALYQATRKAEIDLSPIEHLAYGHGVSELVLETFQDDILEGITGDELISEAERLWSMKRFSYARSIRPSFLLSAPCALARVFSSMRSTNQTFEDSKFIDDRAIPVEFKGEDWTMQMRALANVPKAAYDALETLNCISSFEGKVTPRTEFDNADYIKEEHRKKTVLSNKRPLVNGDMARYVDILLPSAFREGLPCSTLTNTSVREKISVEVKKECQIRLREA